VFWNQSARSWISKAIFYSLSSAVAGLVTGALLGAVGSLLPSGFRWGIGTVFGILAIITGTLELFGRRIKPLEIDCETPRHWLHKGPLAWAIRNGLTLGFGAASRIGFLLWYVVPLGALLSGSLTLGAVIYGTYGLVRGVMAPVLLFGEIRQKADVSDWVILQTTLARLLAAGQLVFVGVTVISLLGSFLTSR
jgi:hypothetical protein